VETDLSADTGAVAWAEGFTLLDPLPLSFFTRQWRKSEKLISVAGNGQMEELQTGASCSSLKGTLVLPSKPARFFSLSR
jgi:hypothetical protein